MMSSLADPAAPLTNSGYRSALARMLPAIFHAYPLAIGRGTIANSQLVRDLLAAAPEEVAAKAGDGRLIVQTDDYVGRTVLLFGDLDAKVSWVVDKLLQTGDNMLDVGANWGLVGMRAAGRVEPTGQVHAVEPQARLVAYGEASRDLNGYANVTFHNLALSETAGVMTLHVPAGNYGQGTLTPEPGNFTGTSQRVSVEQTSAFLESLDVRRWRLWKIDTEGHEAAVLRGATRYLREHDGPDAIIFEEHHNPAAEAESVRLLQSLGYDVFGLPRVILRPRLVPLSGLRPLMVRPRLRFLTRALRDCRDFVAIKRTLRPELQRTLRIVRGP